MQRDYENLVFEGGGVCGFAYCGAISELENLGILQKFKRFAGTSVGAIFAALLAADFTAREIFEMQTIISFSGLSSKYDVSNVFNLFKNRGVNSSSSIRKQILAVLSTRIKKDETLSGLFEKTGKDLVLVSCCLNKEKAVYFHHATHGNVKVIDAIIASLSVPVFFQPLQLEDDSFVDGGIVDNYPIWIFNDIDALYKNKLFSFDREQINPLTLGLKLIEYGQKPDGSRERKPINNTFDIFSLLINTLTSHIDVANYSPKCIEQTIKISSGDIYFLDVEIKREQISQLVKNGIDGVKKYFDNSSC
uniref:PNPLA domain-containing protein n=1 Tax=viral metagenome TaxID=1070528 RepID=A0A6C0H3R0_9ZZZZ